MSTSEGYHDCNKHNEHKRSKKLFTCSGCIVKVFKKIYKCELCDYELHNECRYPRKTASHDFFPGSDFEFCKKPKTRDNKETKKREFSQICGACGEFICGFHYHCKNDKLDLHPSCLNLKKDVTVGGVVYSLKAKVPSEKCIWCKQIKNPDGQGNVPGRWSYISAREKHHVHVDCMPEMLHGACIKKVEMSKKTDFDIPKLKRSRMEELVSKCTSILAIVLTTFANKAKLIWNFTTRKEAIGEAIYEIASQCLKVLTTPVAN